MQKRICGLVKQANTRVILGFLTTCKSPIFRSDLSQARFSSANTSDSTLKRKYRESYPLASENILEHKSDDIGTYFDAAKDIQELMQKWPLGLAGDISNEFKIIGKC
jgi:hypothetical protein